MVGGGDDSHAGHAEGHDPDRMGDLDPVKFVSIGDRLRQFAEAMGGQRLGRFVFQGDERAMIGMQLGTGDSLESADATRGESRGISRAVITGPRQGPSHEVGEKQGPGFG